MPMMPLPLDVQRFDPAARPRPLERFQSAFTIPALVEIALRIERPAYSIKGGFEWRVEVDIDAHRDVGRDELLDPGRTVLAHRHRHVERHTGRDPRQSGEKS
jgi:hypothetical protein